MKLTWLHVSDFHFKGGDSYDRDVVLRALVKSVERFRMNGRAPDLIFATGDVAAFGKSIEYELATKFFDDLLGAAGLQRRHLFVVPGNHDVDRNRGIGLVRTLESRQEADTYFGPNVRLHHLRWKQEEFVSWYNRYFDAIRSFPENSSCGPVEAIDVRGVKIGILPIDTALFCQDDHDHERLWVGRRCLDAAIQELQKIEAQVTVAVFHHPLEWIHPIERSSIRASLRESVGFLLRGHLHDTEIEIVGAPPDQAMYLAAGAAYDSREWPNRALCCTIETQGVTVFPIRYEDEPKEFWTVDTSVFPTEENYEKWFAIPRLAALGDVIEPDEVIISELESVRGLLSNSETRGLLARLRNVLSNAQVTAAGYFSVYQQTAVVVSGLARGLPDDPLSRLVIRRVCERLLAKHGIRLAVPLEQVNELYNLARSDNPDSPGSVWEWVLDHARPVEEDAS